MSATKFRYQFRSTMFVINVIDNEFLFEVFYNLILLLHFRKENERCYLKKYKYLKNNQWRHSVKNLRSSHCGKYFVVVHTLFAVITSLKINENKQWKIICWCIFTTDPASMSILYTLYKTCGNRNITYTNVLYQIIKIPSNCFV